MTAFSKRSAEHHATPNALAAAVAAARARGDLLDLTVANPTTAGIPYDETTILGALGSPGALAYEPAPLGLPSARESVASDYREAGFDITASRIAITASTSEAYAVLFKLLCDPGDEVLVPVPSYPLLAWLASFDNVKLVPYPLVYAGSWHVDIAAMRAAITERTRAIVVVSPNNPTGSYLGDAELAAMLDTGLPIISDEVFARYPLRESGVPEGRVTSVLGAERGLVFALSGLSKLAALPQMKLGWIAAAGDAGLVEAALERVETVLDAYLSVGAPIQHALPSILASRTRASTAIAARTRRNLAVVHELARSAPAMSVLDVEAGWYAILRLPEIHTDEAWALRLAELDDVYVHPGYFFDMTNGAHLVVSLLTPEDDLHAGMARIVRRVSEET